MRKLREEFLIEYPHLYLRSFLSLNKNKKINFIMNAHIFLVIFFKRDKCIFKLKFVV